ncbi:MAG: 4Fe-4S binding protein [Candidatus Omnitrophota bacterium]|nr:MAG: 4Fe-4S binding protein [Candidatus Omnitrophota bacterium]
MAVKIDYEKCCWKDGKCTSCECGGGCIGCVEACPVGALQRKMIVEFSPNTCVDCGACVEACEHNAISLV